MFGKGVLNGWAHILKRGYFMAGIGLSEGHNKAGSGNIDKPWKLEPTATAQERSVTRVILIRSVRKQKGSLLSYSAFHSPSCTLHKQNLTWIQQVK